VAAWNAGTEPEATARARFAHPVPRVQEAFWLKERGARAMIDVSDGLVADAGHIAAASGLRLVIDPELVPLHASVEVVDEALVSGEEYELLVALPPESASSAAQAFRAAFDLPLTRVGLVEPGAGVHVRRQGQVVPAPPSFTHFGS
jgi:thiamine-monophosphate kinase